MVNALRMRPDRIIVGEVRGEEALDMLQAMNTGHDGSLTTIHANSPRDALYRLDTMVAMANLNIPDRAVRQQIASAVNVIVQVSRMADGTRKVTAISELTGMEQDVITMQDIFLFERTGIDPEGKVVGRFRATGVRPKCAEQLPTMGIRLPIDMFEHVQQVVAVRCSHVGAACHAVHRRHLRPGRSGSSTACTGCSSSATRRRGAPALEAAEAAERRRASITAALLQGRSASATSARSTRCSASMGRSPTRCSGRSRSPA